MFFYHEDFFTTKDTKVSQRTQRVQIQYFVFFVQPFVSFVVKKLCVDFILKTICLNFSNALNLPASTTSKFDKT